MTNISSWHVWIPLVDASDAWADHSGRGYITYSGHTLTECIRVAKFLVVTQLTSRPVTVYENGRDHHFVITYTDGDSEPTLVVETIAPLPDIIGRQL